MTKNTKIAKFLRNTSKTALIIFSSLCFIFALLSGSGRYGGGLRGILLNSPNAIPWLLFFIIIYISLKKELILGLISIFVGVITLFFFRTYRSLTLFLVISFPFIITGTMLIISRYLGNENNL